MYSFDGKHRQKPIVSLRGASKKETKSSFMEKRLQERQQRWNARSEISACIRIQKFVRGCLCRKREARKLRDLFDQEIIMLRKKDTKKELRFDDTKIALRMIGFFHNSRTDHDRLIQICQLILKLHNAGEIHTPEGERRWIHQFKTLLYLCLRNLEDSTDPKISITVPLRILEVFLQSYLFSSDSHSTTNSSGKLVILYLIRKGYFRCVRSLINNRVPASLEMSAKPPTPLAASVKNMVLKPIQSVMTQTSKADETARDEIMCNFASEMLCPEMSNQLFLFLIPSLAEDVPIADLLQSILRLSNVDTTSTEINPGLMVNATSWLLYGLLSFGEKQIGGLSLENLARYLILLKYLVPVLPSTKDITSKSKSAEESDSDSDAEEIEIETYSPLEESSSRKYAMLREHCLELLDSPNHVKELVSLVERCSVEREQTSTDDENRIRSACIEAICNIAFALTTNQKLLVHKTRLLQRLAFSHRFMKGTWYLLSKLTTKTGVGKDALFVNQLARGAVMPDREKARIIPVLSIFCTLFRYALFCVYDTDFFSSKAGSSNSMMPFTLPNLVSMSKTLLDVLIGLIQMMFSETRSNVVNAYGKAMLSVGGRPLGDASGLDEWGGTCQAVTLLVRQLHSRDSRHQFCPEGHWLSPRIAINAEQVTIEGFFEEKDENDDTFKPGISALTARSMAILRHIPFSVPFLQRVQIFQRILNQDKDDSHDPAADLSMRNPSSFITVNRKYLYQDAYDQLSQERAPDIKKKIRVKMINAQGLDEAGIDGGGIFREFMSQLVKQGFDPSYGFFKSTPEQLLYPNPQAAKINPDCLKHFHFLGRILGKVIYENMMVEMPFAPFFLCKILNKHSADVDIHHLESLDPELYRNLLSLKNYDGDFDDIALNFTVINEELGNVEVEDLKPGGRDILVTSSNKIEYIHLMADYRLNKQIRAQCNAFRAGLSDVINIEWLQMFGHRELQVLISGAPVPVDLEDLRANTNYSGGYEDGQDYIEALWSILNEFNDDQRRKFIKFVTSCSRPPLLGFKDLYPKMCIHFGGKEDRLPSASTCMNILKLPEYETAEILKSRLLYAVESEAGFELS